VAQGAADRASLRARAVGRFDIAPGVTLALTLGAEHALTRDVQEPFKDIRYPEDPPAEPVESRTPPRSGSMGPGGGGPRPPSLNPGSASTASGFLTTWTNNSGVLAQANVGWRDRLFLSAGGRAERTTGATPNEQVAYLPMLGVSYLHDVRGMELKFRTAYGTGIRPANSLARSATWMGRARIISAAGLEPESQSGVEGGVDLLAGSTTVHITRFDQRASGLIQPVVVSTSTVMNGRIFRIPAYALQNVGAIDNRGWELQASTRLLGVSVSGAYTITDSRVARVAAEYRGDLRVGDRMLDVPSRVGSLSVAWMSSRWNASATLNRAEDWTSYDRVAIGNARAAAGGEVDISGATLRDYWVRYDDVTRLRATLGYRVARQLSVEVGGDNLLDVQRGAPDNATVTAGRTFTFGVRSQF
jgi:iron complex outermembrane receptor protein